MDLWDLTDFATPWAVHVAATLGVARHIDEGVTDAEGLATATGCDTEALRDLLDHLTAKGVFTRTGTDYALTRVGEQLRDNGVFLDLERLGDRLSGAWRGLLPYVRTGRCAYPDLYGADWWKDLAAHPVLSADFDAMMGPAGHGVPPGDLPLSIGWDAVGTVLDAGGGTGSFLAAVLGTYPHLKGVLVDQTETVARAEEELKAYGDRVEIAAGDLFGELPKADVYLLSRILNDWPDEETVAILAGCARAGGPGVRVLVLGGVEPDEGARVLRHETVLVGGRTDALSRFAELCGRAGLRVAAAGEDQHGRYVVELAAG